MFIVEIEERAVFKQTTISVHSPAHFVIKKWFSLMSVEIFELASSNWDSVC